MASVGISWGLTTVGRMCTRLPSVVVPAGHTAAGLPLAAQLIARPYAETTLLQLAHSWSRPLAP